MPGLFFGGPMVDSKTGSEERWIRLLDVQFHLTADDTDAFALLDTLYEAPEFRARPGPEALPIHFRIDPGGPAALIVELAGQSRRLGTSPDRPLEIAEWTFRTMLERSREFLVVHAGALRHRDEGILVVGPPFAGKTTLTLALAAEGLEYLSDDVGALARADGRLQPFRRRAGVRRAAGGREYIMPGAIDGRAGPAPEPCAPRWLFVLEAPRPSLPGERGAWTLIIDPGCEAALAPLAATSGIAVAGRRPWGGGVRFDFAPVEGATLAGALRDCLGAEPSGILYLGPTPRDWGGVSGAKPALHPIGTREAAEEVLRHLLNRAGHADLELRYGHHPHLKMLAEIYRWLAPARAYRVAAGDPAETARLLKALIAEAESSRET